MASFTDILPDPLNPIGTAGEAGGDAGPGFESVKLTSVQPIMRDRTNSGSLVTRAVAAQYWKVDISYNPMTRDQFDVVDSFLMTRRNGLIPFYISLPQYLAPKDPIFATHINSNNIFTVASSGNAGVSYLNIKSSSGTLQGTPLPGDMFTVFDVGDSTHTKAYKVTRIETSAEYNNDLGDPGAGQARIHFNPPLTKSYANELALDFLRPYMRVTLASDTVQHSLGVDNLYTFSLKLEEAQV